MSATDICHIIAAVAVLAMAAVLIYFAYKDDVRSRIEHEATMQSIQHTQQIQRQFGAQHHATLARITGGFVVSDPDTGIDIGCPVCGNNGCPECGEPDIT